LAFNAAPGARLEGIGRAILRHFRLIVFTLVCLNGLAVVIVRMLPLGYAAEAVILVGPREAQMMDMKAVITGQSDESDVIESEMHPGRRRSDSGGRRNQERAAMRVALLINFVIPLPVLVAEGIASRRGLSNCRCLRV
jgi:hypothetical protein